MQYIYYSICIGAKLWNSLPPYRVYILDILDPINRINRSLFINLLMVYFILLLLMVFIV